MPGPQDYFQLLRDSVVTSLTNATYAVLREQLDTVANFAARQSALTMITHPEFSCTHFDFANLRLFGKKTKTEGCEVFASKEAAPLSWIGSRNSRLADSTTRDRERGRPRTDRCGLARVAWDGSGHPCQLGHRDTDGQIGDRSD